MSELLTVHKLDHQGRPIWHYQAMERMRTDTFIVLEARFSRDDYSTPYHTFKKGDRMVEWFYNDRWYNIFALYDRDSDALEGWYCNITRPARFAASAIYAEDLALDVMVYPDGRTLVLDEDEFAQLDIDEDTRRQAQAALHELLRLVDDHWGPFALIQP
jgi:hypothetical protein